MDRKTALAGSLHFTGMPDIFQILAGNGSTGVLELVSQYAPHRGLVYFRNGDPINAVYGPLNGIKAVYALFGWTEGKFEFYKEELRMGRVIRQNRMEIVLDALRMLDDGEIKEIGPHRFHDPGFGEVPGKDGDEGTPVIKGPMIDYVYVVKEEVFKDGAKIVKQGDHGKWMWIVFDGVVRVSRETPEGSLNIARLGEGAFIGTFRALPFGEYERCATVTAEGDVRLCLLDAEPLYSEYACLSPMFRRLLLSLDRRLRSVTNRAVDLYRTENHEGDFIKNKKIFIQQGAPHQELFTIRKGSALIVGQDRGVDLPLVSLEENDVFGSFPFLDFGHEPRSASVFTTKGFQVDRLDVQGLQEEYNNLSSTFRNLIYYVGTCIFMTTRLAYHFHGRRRQLSIG
ncbi:MAG: cyclic nucleotide-binding domain-containing protein [Pseudomonadota bacterium]